MEGLEGMGVYKIGILNQRCQKPDESDGCSWRKGVHTYRCLEEFLKFQIVLKEGMSFFVLAKRSIILKDEMLQWLHSLST